MKYVKIMLTVLLVTSFIVVAGCKEDQPTEPNEPATTEAPE